MKRVLLASLLIGSSDAMAATFIVDDTVPQAGNSFVTLGEHWMRRLMATRSR